MLLKLRWPSSKTSPEVCSCQYVASGLVVGEETESSSIQECAKVSCCQHYSQHLVFASGGNCTTAVAQSCVI